MKNYNDFNLATNEEITQMAKEYNQKVNALQSEANERTKQNTSLNHNRTDLQDEKMQSKKPQTQQKAEANWLIMYLILSYFL